MIRRKLSSRGRTTVPREVLAALDLQEGDDIVYGIENGRVVLEPFVWPGDPFAAFHEWRSEEDERACKGLGKA